MQRLSLIIFAIAIATGIGSVLSYGEPVTGLDIVQRMDARDNGDDLIQKLSQELIDKRGNIRQRNMIVFRKDEGADSKSISYFLEPANIRDTALLTYDYDGSARDDDQWLYLPALKKVRRISSADRGDYFMGTDFTFEDIKQTPEIEDYHWAIKGSEVIDGHDCWIVEGIPKSDALKKNLGYNKTVSFIRKDIDMAIRVDYWDRKGQELKHFYVSSVENIDGIWAATAMEMHNVQTQHRTKMRFSDQKYNSGISGRLFSERMLKRGYRDH
ncbi:MAG: outer membrane lipoprotein-sorting protein [Mariprofundaceae bacterium]